MLSRAFVQIGVGILLGAIPGLVLISNTDLSIGSGGWTTVAAAVGAAGFTLAIATISCIPPVRRALKVQPTEALRTT
jgi:ABC-type antimicrobial peptide transport system permease subunit